MGPAGSRPPRPRVRKGIGFHTPSQPVAQAAGIDGPKTAEDPGQWTETLERPETSPKRLAEGPESHAHTESNLSAGEPDRVAGPDKAGFSAKKRLPWLNRTVGRAAGKGIGPQGSEALTERPKTASAVSTERDSTRIPIKLHREAREAERTKAKRRLLLSRALFLLATAAIAAGLSWLVLFSSLFALNEVDIQGKASKEVEEKVDEVVAHYQGVPLPRVHTGRITEALEQIPDVAKVSVARSWPRGVVVQVEQRMPAAFVLVDGKRKAVGKDGVEIEEPVPKDADLPVLVIGADDSLEANAAAGIKVWESLGPGLATQVATIEMSRQRATLFLEDKTEVVWGKSSNSNEKARVLELLAENRDAEIYDVTDPRRPVIR